MSAFSIILSLVALCIESVFSASGPACSEEPYKALLFLSAYPAAESFCSSKFPLPACITTLSTTSTTVIQTATTITAATVETTVATLSSTTTTGTTTVDITTSTVVTDTTTTTDIVITGTTTTTFTSVPAKKKREAEVTTLKTVAKRDNFVPSILSALESEAQSVIQKACSCIEALPSCVPITATSIAASTITSTVSVTATEPVNATTVVDVEQTVISSITDTDTTTTTTTTTESIATTIVSTACASVAVPSNGNFETGSLSPWVVGASDSVPVDIVAGGYPSGSKYCLQASPMSNNGRFLIFQSLSTCAGVKYSCTYNWKFSAYTDVQNHVPFVEITINDEQVDETDFNSDTAGFWNTDSFTFTGTGDDTIEVIAESPGATVNTLQLDNFVCKYS